MSPSPARIGPQQQTLAANKQWQAQPAGPVPIQLDAQKTTCA